MQQGRNMWREGKMLERTIVAVKIRRRPRQGARMAQSDTANAQRMNEKCRRYDACGAVAQTVNEIRTVLGSPSRKRCRL